MYEQGSQGSGAVSQTALQSSQLRHSRDLPEAMKTGKRAREVQAEGGGAQAQLGADVAGEGDRSACHLAGEGNRSACHLAADECRDGQSNKRRRVGGGQEASSSQGEECAGQGASRQQVAGDQPEAHGGDREGQSSPTTREGDSDVDIGGPEDLLGQPYATCSLACGHPLTQVCIARMAFPYACHKCLWLLSKLCFAHQNLQKLNVNVPFAEAALLLFMQ